MATRGELGGLSHGALLAWSIAGRQIAVAVAASGDRLPHCDGHAIFLPPAMSGPDRDLALVAQALLVVDGSLTGERMRALLARPARAQRYMLIEQNRVARLVAPRLPRLVLQLPDLQLTGIESRGPVMSLELARSGVHLPVPDARLGQIRPGLVLRRGPSGLSVPSMPPETREASRWASPGQQEEFEDSRLLQTFRSPLRSTGSLVSEFFRSLFDMRAASGAEGGGSADGDGGLWSAAGAAPFSPRGAAVPVQTDPGVPSGSLDAPIASAFCYPEWDARLGRYRDAWVQLAEVEPERPGVPTAGEGPPVTAGPTLQRGIARLCLGHGPLARQREGDDIVIDDLVRFRTAQRTGHAREARFHRKPRRIRRELGVSVLLDITASSADPAGDGRALFELQRDGALQLVRALSEAGDRVSCHGFHSWGRKLVRLQRVKGFDDRADVAMRARLAALRPVGYSRLGAAIRHGHWLLQNHSGMPRGMIVLISDGLAYDQDYEGEHAVQDTRRALREARARGLACLCLDLSGRSQAGSLRGVFGEAHHLRLPVLQGMEGRLARALERSLREAGSRG